MAYCRYEALTAEELSYEGKAAAQYDGAFAQVTTHFAPFLLRAAHITSGMRVLDIATGTALVAETALTVVGSAGHVTAADLSPAMLESARSLAKQKTQDVFSLPLKRLKMFDR